MKNSAIVIGAGIVGLATARALAEKNYHVKVFERNEKCVGASVRNFGLIWPIGQPSGKLYQRALRSREIWLDIIQKSKIWHSNAGALMLAYNDDERNVLEEFFQNNCDTRDLELFTNQQISERWETVNPQGLKAGLLSKTEVIIDPREAINTLAYYLNECYGIEFYFGKTINRIEQFKVWNGKDIYEADQIFVCSGSDFETLFSEEYKESGITKCKLQMMRSLPINTTNSDLPALCAGLTLSHYASFADCKSMEILKQRFENEMPEYVKHGIHVMAVQNGKNEITIGDSHKYGLNPDPFDRAEINQLIYQYMSKFTRFENLQIAQTWNGVIPKIEGQTEFIFSPQQGVTIINRLGGGGMTLSFALAEEVIATI